MKIQTVLMVDDDPAIRRIAHLSLSRVAKWDVILAESGAQAIEEALKVHPDVILMDVMMPNMDGPTALKHLQERPEFSSTPVIFMTAKVLREEVESYTNMGAAGVITKPFDPLVLPGTIKEILSTFVPGAKKLASCPA